MRGMDRALGQLSERIRAAAADGTKLRVRGGGSKDFYGESPAGEILSTASLGGILSYEPSELVVTAGAGTPLAELEAVLAAQGQCLPFEPPRFEGGGAAAGATTVGGMVAAGLSGPARASVGAVRDYVLGATLMNGRGELLRFGGQVMKNVAGYDVSRVLAGSLGVLGVIVDVSLKVLPVAPAQATLEFACSQADALRLLNEWGGRPLPLNASLWCEREGRGVLLLRLGGAVAAVAAACAQLGGQRQDDAQAASDWRALRDQQLPWFAGPGSRGDLWRLSVPQTAPALDIADAAGAPWIEWHGGQRWYRAAPGAGPALRAAARAVGGHATLFRPAAGTDTAAGGRFDLPGAPAGRIMRALMASFDPDAVFDRNRLYPNP
jgi:glycolate oxidase FAD binding subunit